MAGAVADCQLSAAPAAGVRFALATAAEDAAVRRLLRNNPLPGEISLTLEREPDYARGADVAGATDRTILALAGERLAALGRCSVRRRQVDGGARRVGYLAELRLDASARGRFDILRGGYRFFRDLAPEDTPEYFFTSIAADNHRALRLLERGCADLPAYQFLTGFVTLVIPVPRRRTAARRTAAARSRLEARGLRVEPGTCVRIDELVGCLNRHAFRHPLAAVWTPEEVIALARHDLALDGFRLVLAGAQVVACAALWDQRGFRQTVVRGYAGRLRRLRPLLNLSATIFGTPRLPPAGSILALGFLSPFATDPGYGDLLPELVALNLAPAAERGLEFLTLGLAADDPRLAPVRRRFAGREYCSRIYRVAWPGDAPSIAGRAGGPFLPEVALL